MKNIVKSIMASLIFGIPLFALIYLGITSEDWKYHSKALEK